MHLYFLEFLFVPLQMAAAITSAPSSNSAATTLADKLVADLYHFRDHYCETHPMEAAAKREEHVAEALQACLEKLGSIVG